ncbi:BrnA antitoxin family protein [Mangrovitalea sediminis]|uniref:BrnA antitoxin family protein n=1 Tax=Mangrovitalea sediminis TaxID=1982043 RepID=UPI0018E9C6C2|nr:BrnA antitoxin family protein [Mangrovitalea sediminis]
MRQQYIINSKDHPSAQASNLSDEAGTPARSYLQYRSLRDSALDPQAGPESERLPTKKAFTMRLDADVLAWFQSQGRGYQTRINQLLRQHMEAQES